nr:beta-glucosidase BoGH3B-like [Tanacetum cinerariifolium]GEV44766.1 beta-glucosidase BoGH3B-like [Tanacetum cinerariifolium]
DYKDLAREAVRKSLVLLKNVKRVDQPMLPLPKNSTNVLIVAIPANDIGRPVVIEPYVYNIDALVAAWLPGTEGQCVIDVLFGDYCFTGRLAQTWFKSVDRLPMNVGDLHYDPLYPFGFSSQPSLPRDKVRTHCLVVLMIFLNFTTLLEASKALHLKESIIKFTVKYGKTPLTLNYQTFCQSMGLEYNNGNYVAHSSTKEVRTELAKIATHDVLVLDGNHSSTEQINSSQQLIIFNLCTGTKIKIREIIHNDIVTRLMVESRQTYVSYPRFISYALQRLLGSDYPQDHKFRSIPSVMSQTNFSKNPFEVTTIKLTAFMNDLISHETSVSPLLVSEKKGKKKTYTVTKPTRKSQGPEAFEALPQKGKKPSTDPQDIEGNIQPTVKGLPSTTDEDIRTSSLLSEAQPIFPNDSKGTYSPLVRDCLTLTMMKV